MLTLKFFSRRTHRYVLDRDDIASESLRKNLVHKILDIYVEQQAVLLEIQTGARVPYEVGLEPAMMLAENRGMKFVPRFITQDATEFVEHGEKVFRRLKRRVTERRLWDVAELVVRFGVKRGPIPILDETPAEADTGYSVLPMLAVMFNDMFRNQDTEYIHMHPDAKRRTANVLNDIAQRIGH